MTDDEDDIVHDLIAAGRARSLTLSARLAAIAPEAPDPDKLWLAFFEGADVSIPAVDRAAAWFGCALGTITSAGGKISDPRTHTEYAWARVYDNIVQALRLNSLRVEAERRNRLQVHAGE